MANDLIPARLSGTCMGLINMITMASAMIVQPVMGYLVALGGPVGYVSNAPVYLATNYQRVFWVVIGLFLLASLLSTKLIDPAVKQSSRSEKP